MQLAKKEEDKTFVELGAVDEQALAIAVVGVLENALLRIFLGHLGQQVGCGLKKKDRASPGVVVA